MFLIYWYLNKIKQNKIYTTYTTNAFGIFFTWDTIITSKRVRIKINATISVPKQYVLHHNNEF